MHNCKKNFHFFTFCHFQNRGPTDFSTFKCIFNDLIQLKRVFSSSLFYSVNIIFFFTLKKGKILQAHGVQLKNDSFFGVHFLVVLLAVAGLSRFLPFVFLHSPQACFLPVFVCVRSFVFACFFSFGLFCLCFCQMYPARFGKTKKKHAYFRPFM